MRKRLQVLKRWPQQLWFPDRHVLVKMPLEDLHHHNHPQSPPSPSPSPKISATELTSLLSDELLLRILSLLPPSTHTTTSLVSKRFLRLLGLLRRSLSLRHWPFLLLGRLPSRFPLLHDLDLFPSQIHPTSPSPSSSPLLLSRGPHSLPLDVALDPDSPIPNSNSNSNSSSFLAECRFLRTDSVNAGILVVARSFPNLRRLSLAATASELTILELAGRCNTLQELEIHRCSDVSLRPVSAFQNLQILRIVGILRGLYTGPGVTDIGLTILAHGCKRLVKLELSGCEGSYDGISAIGRCCLMLEELTISDHRMDAGWLAGLSYCANLKTLKLLACRSVDADPGLEEHLGSCVAIERLHLQRCQLRDRRSLNALFVVCGGARDLVFQDCWGLDDDMFGITLLCRRVKFLRVEGCSLLTTGGLESVIISWKELQSLSVVSCKSIKDCDISPALSNLFAVLKELKWRPDSQSVLLASLNGTGMGKKGGRFFKRT